MADQTVIAGIRPRRRLYLLVELALLFIGAPVAMHFVIHAAHVPLFVVLLPVMLLIIGLLLADRTFSLKRALGIGFSVRTLLSIFGFFAIAAPLIALGTWYFQPEVFLAMPLHIFPLWLFVMIAYPLISVTTQELVYRVFFFHRYGALFGDARTLSILVNGVLFSFGHIMFQNWVAIIACLFGGVLFAWRYRTTGSLWAVLLEHALYGDLIFTVGLGRYFFTGVANLIR